jgi:hypothetical protein
MNGQKVLCAQFTKKGIMFAILLYNRLSTIIEPEIGNYQMRFRPNRSKLDNIFVMRQIYEQC